MGNHFPFCRVPGTVVIRTYYYIFLWYYVAYCCSHFGVACIFEDVLTIFIVKLCLIVPWIGEDIYDCETDWTAFQLTLLSTGMIWSISTYDLFTRNILVQSIFFTISTEGMSFKIPTRLLLHYYRTLVMAQSPSKMPDKFVNLMLV